MFSDDHLIKSYKDIDIQDRKTLTKIIIKIIFKSAQNVNGQCLINNTLVFTLKFFSLYAIA